jgi:lipopolysaccharide/colanic/teichoic acid biosynthesis glycosyltransferase
MNAERTRLTFVDVTKGVCRRREQRNLRLALMVADYAVITLAVVMTDLVRIALENYFRMWPLAAERHLIASILVPPALVVLFWLDGLYDLDLILVGTREYTRILQSVAYGVFIALAISYFAGGNPLISRLWLLLIFGLTSFAVLSERFVARRVVRRERRRGRLRTRVVVVGASTHGVAIAQQLLAANNEGFDVIGFLDEYVPTGQRLLGNIAVIGRPSEVLRPDAADRADEYILVPQALPAERLDEIGRAMVARGSALIRIAVSTSDLLTNGVLIAERANVPMLRVRAARIVGVDALLKRTLDVTGAMLGLIVLGPIALSALFWAWARGTRPILRRYEVRGSQGEPVSMWLLDREVSSRLAVRGAPALVAVLRGGMSLVGPRPVLQRARERGELPAPLALVKPGLTGPWRLGGGLNSVDVQEARDLAYARNYSLWTDLRLLAALFGVLTHRQPRPHVWRWESGRPVRIVAPIGADERYAEGSIATAPVIHARVGQ